MDVPAWFKLIKWNAPVALEDLRANRSQIPAGAGVYAFTNYPGPLQANLGVLYVGAAKMQGDGPEQFRHLGAVDGVLCTGATGRADD